jgi:hypothetical protein
MYKRTRNIAFVIWLTVVVTGIWYGIRLHWQGPALGISIAMIFSAGLWIIIFRNDRRR